jgi:hypothetical protein
MTTISSSPGELLPSTLLHQKINEHLTTLEKRMKLIAFDAKKREMKRKSNFTSLKRKEIQIHLKKLKALALKLKDIYNETKTFEKKLNAAKNVEQKDREQKKSLESSMKRYELIPNRKFRVPSTSKVIHNKNVLLVQEYVLKWKKSLEVFNTNKLKMNDIK